MTTQTPVVPPGGAAPAATTIDFETTKEVGYYHLVWRRFKQRKIAYVAAITMVVLILSCYVLPIFLPADCPDLSQTDLGPFSVGHSTNAICGVGTHFHLLGTDANGRDLLVRNLEGGRISLLVGFATMVVTIFIGTVITAVTNATLSIPSVLILIIIVKTFNSDGHATPMRNIVLAPSRVPIIG